MCLSLNNFCCCISLSSGAKIVSVISTAVSASILVLYGAPAILQMFSLPPARAIFYGVTAVAALFKTIFGCMLIHGTFKKKPSYTWPWLLVSWVYCIALAALSVAGIVFMSYNQQENHGEISSVVFVYLLYALVLFYFISIVNSRRQEMIADEFSYTSKRVRKMNSYYYS